MERNYFEKQKSDILDKILEAVEQNDTQAIYSYCRIMRDLERKLKKNPPHGDKSKQ